MRYLALGDSISIDDYTGVKGGGAVSQFARRIGAQEVLDLTLDGQVAAGVLAQIRELPPETRAEVVTLTVGGNDLLMGAMAAETLPVIEAVAERLSAIGDTVIINTIYDPTDGSNEEAVAAEIGFLASAAEMRSRFDAMNSGIRVIAGRFGFALSDLEWLFRGHGIRSPEPWFVLDIEPNLAGATAIAAHWETLAMPSRP